MGAVSSILGRPKVGFYGAIQYAILVEVAIGFTLASFISAIQHANLVGVAISYTIAYSISMQAVSRAWCFYKRGYDLPYKSSSNPYMILFGIVLILLSWTPKFDQIWWFSILAAVMKSFIYSSIGLSLGITQTISNGWFNASLIGICIGASIVFTQEIYQAFGDIAFAYFFTDILIEIQDKMKTSHECDLSRFMGSAVINTDGSCAICAVVMCMEAQYKRLNESTHGANSWGLKATAQAVESLKDLCKKGGVWTPTDGALTEDVLEVIRSLEQGLSTVNGNASMRLKSYETFMAVELSPLKITSMLHKTGPLVGVLYADEKAYDDSTLYRVDCRDFEANHVVVCTGYYYFHGELFIIIMDNQECDGPFRFVQYEAFEEFHVLIVDVSCAS